MSRKNSGLAYIEIIDSCALSYVMYCIQSIHSGNQTSTCHTSIRKTERSAMEKFEPHKFLIVLLYSRDINIRNVFKECIMPDLDPDSDLTFDLTAADIPINKRLSRLRYA